MSNNILITNKAPTATMQKSVTTVKTPTATHPASQPARVCLPSLQRSPPPLCRSLLPPHRSPPPLCRSVLPSTLPVSLHTPTATSQESITAQASATIMQMSTAIHPFIKPASAHLPKPTQSASRLLPTCTSFLVPLHSLGKYPNLETKKGNFPKS
ncbi:hypothetical protein DSO57_1012500 [Entomophthora muscae]|uniref:Uncharacterized protein n=1 Tax=Entomophthora muscae TaxID=34485 RepID=A0ACC2T6W5_9FUNG|nr:hypothetical protein DSO57_1012500 [Entomophthora muscae]